MTTTPIPAIEIPAEMNDSPVSKVLSTFWDGGDVWGSAMAEGFAVCDFVHFHLGDADEIPAELGYRPALDGTSNASEDDLIYLDLVDSFEYGDFTKADAFDYLPILNRFLDACKVAGLDY